MPSFCQKLLIINIIIRAGNYKYYCVLMLTIIRYNILITFVIALFRIILNLNYYIIKGNVKYC